MSGLGLSGRARAAVSGLVLALAALTALVQAGALTRVDQFGVDHLMPALDPAETASNGLQGLDRPFGPHTNWWSKLLDLWTYPCSVLVSGLVVAAVCAFEWRRGRIATVVVLAAAWVVGNGVEVVGKDVITRPDLYGAAGGVRLHVASFDNSFPSGHMIRGAIVAAAIVLVWRRLTPWVVLWWALIGPSLVLQSAHTPSDVVGGGLVGLILLLAGRGLIASPLARRLEGPRPGT